MIDAASTTAAAPGPTASMRTGTASCTWRATACSLRSNIAGSTRFAITAAGWVPVSRGQPLEEFDRFGDGHLLGGGRDDHPRALGIFEDVEHPLGLLTDEADLDEFGDHPGGADLADDVATRFGVHHDEVVVAFLDLPAQLADGEDLLDARCRVGDEVECGCEDAEAADERDPDEETEVLA